jgi:hypothetical protein
METPDIYKFSEVHLICDSNVRILDFLADLHDREPLRGMDRFLKWGNNGSMLLLYDCPLDDMVILLLYKSPFTPRKSKDRWMLYYTKDIRSMYKYFKSWLNVTYENHDDRTAALTEITRLLIDTWAELPPDKKTPRLTIGEV